jgi:hypothetical protein
MALNTKVPQSSSHSTTIFCHTLLITLFIQSCIYIYISWIHINIIVTSLDFSSQLSAFLVLNKLYIRLSTLYLMHQPQPLVLYCPNNKRERSGALYSVHSLHIYRLINLCISSDIFQKRSLRSFQ